ncbi:hypothetical protein [Acinetobacter terrae]|uniref:hypothetical protein n=1 Tax=Acinetobacter terrae TaxID=2731247 RepID=UPI0007D795CD|nr:hypothetical protein [Acinetobacter terrae]OAL76343.1 hypothetical protein AY608_08485 [Acinetobacter terrae]
MKSLTALWVSALISTTGFAGQQAFLVQNSGWMEPFYQDENSQFKPLINAVIQTVSQPNDKVVVSVFNQTNALTASPQIIYQGAANKDLKSLLNEQGIAKKSVHTYADTDFKEAVISTITGPFQKKSGIIWIFTNNKNSPNNDVATIERNKEFYELIHLDSAINKVIAFPLKMPVQGQHFKASGLMVYALAYGSAAENELNQLVQSGQMSKVFTQQPALLKPLDKEAVRLIPTGVKNSAAIQASLAADQKTLVFSLEPKHVIPELKLTADLKNNFYPYNIAATQVDAKLTLANGMQAPIQISQKDIQLVGKDNVKLEFNLPIPSHLIVSPWSLEVFKAMGKAVTIPATINVTLSEQKLSLSDEFKENLQHLFPGDPLSDVFVAPQNIKSSTAAIPVQFKLQYPLWPVVVLMGGILLLIVLVILAMALASKRKRYEIWVNGLKKQTIQIKPFAKCSIYGEAGREIAIVKRGVSEATVQNLDKETTVTIRSI